MADLRDLARWSNALPDRIEKAASRIAADTATAMVTYLIAKTPVDTSEALSNWQAALNAPPAFGIPAIYEGERGSTAVQSSNAALRAAKRAIAEKRPGEQIYLSNLTPYIIDLNRGSSKQAPPGWIEGAMIVGERFAARASFKV